MSPLQEEVDSDDRSPSNPLQSKINKIISLQLEDDKALLEALRDVSSLVVENTLVTRRGLRGAIERRSVAVNSEFVESLRGLRDSLDVVHADIGHMATSCGQMAARLSAARRRGSRLLADSAQLRADAERLRAQQRLLAAYTRRFQLTEQEVAALRRDPPAAADFFPTLQRVQQIHADVKRLLQAGHRQTPLEIMDQMSLYQEAAYERLYNWAKSRVRSSESEMDDGIIKAMSCLQERPALFQHVLDEYCASRRQLLVGHFIEALTAGGVGARTGGTVSARRPIELHAHNPLRYVGDMLAWLHQAAPAESDGLAALLRGTRGADGGARLDACLAAVWEGVCRPLRTRVEQVLTGCTSVAVLLKLCGVLEYYSGSALPAVGGGALADTLQQLRQLAASCLLQSLRSQTQRLCERVEPPTDQLQPSPAFVSCLQLVREALSADSVVETRRQLVEDTLSCVLPPLLTALAETSAPLAAADSCVYQLNCLHRLHETLQLHEFCDEQLRVVAQRLDSQLERLTSEQASATVQSLGLAPIHAELEDEQKAPSDSAREPSTRPPLSQRPGLSEAVVRQFLHKLDLYLANPELLQLAQLRHLYSMQQRLCVRRRAAEVVLVIYGRLYTAVHLPSSQYHDPTALMPRTTQQLQSLLTT